MSCRNRAAFYLWERIGSPIFIVRGRDDKLRGFYNTCRHRGAPIVREQTGRRNLFRMYLSWLVL